MKLNSLRKIFSLLLIIVTFVSLSLLCSAVIFADEKKNKSMADLKKSINEMSAQEAVESYLIIVDGEKPIKSALKKEQTLKSFKVSEPPVIDGKTDSMWNKIAGINVWDNVAKINITLKSCYTSEKIYFLVSFNDPDESREHKAWEWNKKEGIYIMNENREDVFTFKWNMESKPVDLSVYADNAYITDIWFWKAERTDPVGYADDKIDKLMFEKAPKSTEIRTKTGKTMYLTRESDKGKTAFEAIVPAEYKGEKIPQFKHRQPEGSCADIAAKGVWANGKWTIEFSRNLKTGNDDDVQFDISKKYQFGVSRYEIAGRKPELDLSQPLYGCGDIYNNIILNFVK